jgi:Asp-tRNA(Asn)/Glu-tRNA(Gln) amidotransferase C subunit
MSSVYKIFDDIISRANTLVSPSSSSSSSDDNFITFLDEQIAELNTFTNETIGEEDYNNLMNNLNKTITEFSDKVTRNIIELSNEEKVTLLEKLNTILDFLNTFSPNKDTHGVTPTSDVTPDSLKKILSSFLTSNNTEQSSPQSSSESSPQSSSENGGSKRKSTRKNRKSNRKSRKSNKKSKRKSNRKSKK